MTTIIAEAGVNHNGEERLAFELVDAAHRAGADIVKFQTFKASSLVTRTAKQADYQVKNMGSETSQHQMLKNLELRPESHVALLEHCRRLGIEFLSTAFDSESLRFLVSEIGLKTLKIPSGEVTNSPFLLEHARTGCKLILSTGMATLGEVEQALGVIAYGLMESAESAPSEEAFLAAYASREGQAALRESVTLLHCTTEYPAPMQDINLRAMDTMRGAFGLPVGYSDHSEGIEVATAAVARGAAVIEKHFTLDRNMEGPDHAASLEPNELEAMVRAIRNVETALGEGVKSPQPSEIKNRPIARKSLVAAKAIKKGGTIGEEDISIKRPGTGVSPHQYWKFLGSEANREFKEDELL